MSAPARIAVVGAGVVGLSVALRLTDVRTDVRTDVHHDVTVHHDRQAGTTTSATAAGLIEPAAPPAAPETADLVRRAFARSYRHFMDLADAGSPIVTRCRARSLWRAEREPEPWTAEVEGFRVLGPGDLPAPYGHGEEFATCVVETREWLADAVLRLRRRGVAFVRGRVSSFEDLVRWSDVVVNCAGVRATDLADDPALSRLDGTVVRVARPPGPMDVVHDWDPEPVGDVDVVYVIPRRQDVVLGGTRTPRPVSAGEPVPDPATVATILEACRRMVPALAGAPVIAVSACSRPQRPAVRLEAERLADGTPLVHCYGTGGSGWTLAPGLAWEAADLLTRVLAESDVL